MHICSTHVRQTPTQLSHAWMPNSWDGKRFAGINTHASCTHVHRSTAQSSLPVATLTCTHLARMPTSKTHGQIRARHQQGQRQHCTQCQMLQKQHPQDKFRRTKRMTQRFTVNNTADLRGARPTPSKGQRRPSTWGTTPRDISGRGNYCQPRLSFPFSFSLPFLLFLCFSYPSLPFLPFPTCYTWLS